MPLSKLTSASIADSAVTTAKIANNAITSSQLASGAVGSSQITAGSIGATQLAPYVNMSGKEWYGSSAFGISRVIPCNGNRYLLLFPRDANSNGACGIYNIALSNYDGPSGCDLHFHVGFDGGGWSMNAAGTSRYGVNQISLRRVTYAGASYYALYNSGATNREWRINGVAHRLNDPYPFMVSSVTSDDQTYITL